MAYRQVYFRIHTKGYSSGWSSDADRSAFKEESRRLFQELGWTIKLGHNGGCDVATKNQQNLYLHPTSFSGVIDESNIQSLQKQILKAQTFRYEGVDCYRVSETYGCSGYASMVSSLIFGDQANPARRLEDLSQIRPGDIIFMVRNSTGKVWHVTVALESPNEKNAFHITDGNAGETVQWPDRENPYGRDNLDCYCGEGKSYHLEVWTRYPESVPYSGDSVMGWPTGK